MAIAPIVGPRQTCPSTLGPSPPAGQRGATPTLHKSRLYLFGRGSSCWRVAITESGSVRPGQPCDFVHTKSNRGGAALWHEAQLPAGLSMLVVPRLRMRVPCAEGAREKNSQS